MKFLRLRGSIFKINADLYGQPNNRAMPNTASDCVFTFPSWYSKIESTYPDFSYTDRLFAVSPLSGA
ncbi:MAG: hypothetical protein Kapaf2KO_10380 [Candidatus Kapaibacteriales bacterium]